MPLACLDTLAIPSLGLVGLGERVPGLALRSTLGAVGRVGTRSMGAGRGGKVGGGVGVVSAKGEPEEEAACRRRATVCVRAEFDACSYARMRAWCATSAEDVDVGAVGIRGGSPLLKA